MARENPTWGAPRIAAELRLLGHAVAISTVSKYLPAGRRPPSPTWKTFLRNHVGCLASVDFCVVPTVTFRLLYVFVVLCHPDDIFGRDKGSSISTSFAPRRYGAKMDS